MKWAGTAFALFMAAAVVDLIWSGWEWALTWLAIGVAVLFIGAVWAYEPPPLEPELDPERDR